MLTPSHYLFWLRVREQVTAGHLLSPLMGLVIILCVSLVHPTAVAHTGPKVHRVHKRDTSPAGQAGSGEGCGASPPPTRPNT